ncbi:unnamed protein product [marine sediment metagenome]|uniref:Uncharacterized protein n=1 Tax=marine sediment metagenome TaxID=412755 RepID=X1SXU0_9ZZZZ
MSALLTNLAGRVEETGREAKEAATIAFKVADKALKKAEQTDVAGDEALAAAMKALDKLISRSEEMAKKAREAAETTVKSDMVPKLVKEVLSSRQFLLIILLTVLGTLFTAVALSVGLISLGP